MGNNTFLNDHRESRDVDDSVCVIEFFAMSTAALCLDGNKRQTSLSDAVFAELSLFLWLAFQDMVPPSNRRIDDCVGIK